MELPLQIKYNRSCEEWHPKSMPSIVDNNGKLVAEVPQFVDHPGRLDEKAINIATTIVKAVNTTINYVYLVYVGYNREIVGICTTQELANKLIDEKLQEDDSEHYSIEEWELRNK